MIILALQFCAKWISSQENPGKQNSTNIQLSENCISSNRIQVGASKRMWKPYAQDPKKRFCISEMLCSPKEN